MDSNTDSPKILVVDDSKTIRRTAETLLKKSDDAMYAVKRGGKNNFDFSNT